MKNKKSLIICIIIIVLIAILYGGYKVLKTYIFEQETGKIPNGHQELLNHLTSITDDATRKNAIDFSLGYNLITQQEADNLY